MRIGRRARKARALRKEIAARDAGWSTDLRAWVMSLPFVEERGTDAEDTDFREFVIDCPPLQIRRIWLLMAAVDAECEVMAFITHADGDVSCIELSTSVDTRDVEAALLLAYESTFARCS